MKEWSKISKKAMTGLAFAIACISIPAVTSQANQVIERGTTYVPYSTTVGRFGGSGYTNYQSKTNSGTAAQVRKFHVGGNYSVRTRLQSTNNNGTWTGYKGGTGSTSFSVPANSNHTAGTHVRLQHQNGLATAVNVQVNGEWRSN